MNTKLRIILGGLLRGSHKAHKQLKTLQTELGAKIYVSSYDHWGDLPFEYEFISTKVDSSNFVFHQNTHDHSNKYIAQWEHLYNCYFNFSKNFNPNDIILKYRNDIDIENINDLIDIFKTTDIKNNILYTPQTEFHENKPFDQKVVCNDQVYFFNKTTADSVFRLPIELNKPDKHYLSIEKCLREFLYQKDISLNTFPLDYKKSPKMINTCIFTTHATLDLKHAEYSLKSLLQYQSTDIIWDNFVIYNTHEHEVSNSDIIDLINKYDTKNYIKEIFVFPYDPNNNKKNLLQDIRNWYDIGLSLGLSNNPGKVLWLKSDYCLSNNFNEVFLNHPNDKFMWSLPIYNAKQRISYDDILNKLNLPEFSPTDEKTYYRGGDNPNNTIPNEEISPNGEMDYHPSIDYVSHNYVHDFNLHVISNDSLNLGRQISYHPQVFDMDSTWGGPHNLFFGLRQNNIHFSGETKAYGIHMFHEIISENRKDDRGDIRKLHVGEKY